MNAKQQYPFGRRQFLRTAVAVGTAAVLPHNLMAADRDVSEKPNSGPVTAQTMTTAAASANVTARPAAREAALASSANACAARFGCMRWKREDSAGGSTE